MNDLMIFEGHQVEVFEFEGQVLFNPYHCGDCLDLTESAVRNHLSKMNEKQAVVLKNSTVRDKDIRKLHNTGEKFLTESGIYKLIFKSNKPDAEKFQDWVTDEVLPEIRKTGSYNSMPQGIELLALAVLEADKTINLLKADNSRLAVQNTIMTPKAEYFDDLVERNLLTNFRDTAKELKVGQRYFIKFLLEKKYVYRDKKGKIKPFAGHDDLFEIKEAMNEKTGWAGTQTLITPKGRETFRLLMI